MRGFLRRIRHGFAQDDSASYIANGGEEIQGGVVKEVGEEEFGERDGEEVGEEVVNSAGMRIKNCKLTRRVGGSVVFAARAVELGLRFSRRGLPAPVG